MNLLVNAEFDEPTLVEAVVSKDGYSRFHVPRAWQGGALTVPAPFRWINRIPEGGAHTGARKLSGVRSFHVYYDYGTFSAWLYQRVPVMPSTPLSGGAHVYIEGTDGAVARVGIDPLGGQNPFARTVVWSAWATQRDAWTPCAVSVGAESASATLFLYATQTNYVEPNGVYWDAAFVNGTPPESEQESSAQMVTLAYNMRFRAGPGTQYAEIARLERGKTVTLLARSVDGLWLWVEAGGRQGWLATQFISSPDRVMGLPVRG